MEEGIVLGHHISKNGIQVDPAKIEVILNLQTLQNKRMSEASLAMQGIIEGL